MEVLVICLTVYASCQFQAIADGESLTAVQREWGAVCRLSHVDVFDGVRRDQETVLTGPFDVWEGAWFRIPLTVFHHQYLLQLVFVMVTTLFLGRLLEQKWGSFYFGLFLLPAMTLPVIAELCLGNAVMGFSGTVFAILGALSVLRLSDTDLAARLPVESVLLGITLILLGFLANLSGIADVSNISHVTGFIYGGIVAACVSENSTFVRTGLVLSHLWLIPALVLVTNPVWIGRYHWYKATTPSGIATREKLLQKAILCDPTLPGAWLHLAKVAEEKQDLIEAWKRLVRGLTHNPTSGPLIDATRRLWRHLDFDQRKEAEFHLHRAFGRKSTLWLKSIRSNRESLNPSEIDETFTTPEQKDLSDVALDQKVELPVWDWGNHRPRPRQKREDFDDAAEGQRL